MQASVVIEAMVKAASPNASPAVKAAATRQARRFCAQQEQEKGQNPIRTMAALKANVTRRLP